MIQRRLFRIFSENLGLWRNSFKNLSLYPKEVAPPLPYDYAIQMYNSKTDFEDVQKIVNKDYLPEANVSLAFNFNDPDTRLEFDDYFSNVLNDGLTMVARELHTNRIVGFITNKIQSYCHEGDPLYFEEYLQKYKNPNFLKYLADRAAIERTFNLFKMYKCEHIYRMVTLTVHRECRGQYIAYNLLKQSVKVAENMVHGIYPETMCYKQRGKVPEIICSSATSENAVKMCMTLGLSVIMKCPLTQVIENGSMSRKLPPNSFTTLLMKKL